MFSKLTKSSWGKRAQLVVTALLLACLVTACGNDSTPKQSLNFKDAEGGSVVATYTGGQVTEQEFNKFKAALAFSQGIDASLFDMEGYREYILEQYVVYKVMASRSSEEVLAAAQTEATAQEESIKQYFETYNMNYDSMVQEYGITNEDVSTFFYLGSAVSEYLNSQVSEDEAKAQYENNLADYSTYDVRHVLVNFEVTSESGETTTRTDEEALARANEAKAKLEGGASWEEVAAEYSDDPGSSANGGLYANYQGSSWVEEFKMAAYEQEVGVIGEPVASVYGYHVIQVDKRETPAYADLSETVKDEIIYTLANEKFAQFFESESEALNIQMSLPPIEDNSAEDATDANNATDADNATDGAADNATEGSEAAKEEKPAATE